jgi:hypothetical protein
MILTYEVIKMTVIRRLLTNVGFVVDKVALGQVSSRVLWFSPVSLTLPGFCYLEKRKNLTILITGLHNKPYGWYAPVASAAGPFTTQKHAVTFNCLSLKIPK